jgi:hypothetical protein
MSSAKALKLLTKSLIRFMFLLKIIVRLRQLLFVSYKDNRKEEG